MKNSSLLLFLSSFLVASFIGSCQKDVSDPSSVSADQPANSATSNSLARAVNAKSGPKAYVYIESNETGMNHILIYNQNPNGILTYNGTIASGEAGTGTGLGSQGALAMSQDNGWLFAVNAGDNTISSFAVQKNSGGLVLKNTVSSGGSLPISITVYENFVYVLNANSANINGFMVNASGTLSPIPNSQQSLSGIGTSPEQISFGPNGNIVFVTEKAANMIASFTIDLAGNSSAGVFTLSTGNNPYGFDFAHHRFLVVSNAEGGNNGASTVTDYNGAQSGTISAVNGAVADNGGSACWLATDKNGFFAYVSNASSNTISSFSIAPNDGKLVLLNTAAGTGNHPLDIMVSADDSFVYNINNGDQTIGEFSRGSNGSLVSLGTVTGLPASAGGLVGY